MTSGSDVDMPPYERAINDATPSLNGSDSCGLRRSHPFLAFLIKGPSDGLQCDLPFLVRKSLVSLTTGPQIRYYSAAGVEGITIARS